MPLYLRKVRIKSSFTVKIFRWGCSAIGLVQHVENPGFHPQCRHTHTRTRTHAYIHKYTHGHKCTHVHTNAHAHTHACTHTHLHLHPM
jgi:hypothetical protein